MSSLKEVAKKSNVSISTVSRVINNPGIVKADTRKKVQKAMSSLNYQPNRVAQRLRVSNGHSKLIGLIIPDIQNQFYSKIVRGIEDVTYRHNYAVILCNSDENPDKELFYLQILESESVDGIIFPPIRQHSKNLNRKIDSNIPLICVDRKFTDDSVDSVVLNNAEGAHLAISHLVKLKHEHIAIISSSLEFSSFKERKEGYKQALKNCGFEVNPDLIKDVDPRRSQEAKDATHELFNLSLPPTALFITNNLMALGALEALNELNLQIPEDISLIMFDDLPWSTVVNPPLTVIRQPGYQMGKKAAELFFQRIENPNKGIFEVKLDPQLIIRNSTGVPKTHKV